MNAAERLYEQYRRELQRLQETCPHERLTDWMEEWWAPGHSTGREVQACTECNKTVRARRRCYGCSRLLLEEELQPRDGRLRPVGSWYCETCRKGAGATA